MVWIYRFICGYVRIIISGDNPEKIINLMNRNGILFWGIKKSDNNLYVSLLKKDFFYLFRLKKRGGLSVRISEKVGCPFIIKRYRKRPGIPIGILLFSAILFFLSGRIWNLEIIGIEKIDEKEIISVLEEMNIAVGKSNRINNAEELKQILLLKVEGISWATINVIGSDVQVIVSEIDRLREAEKPSNFLSLNDAIIKRINVQSGTTRIKVGDTVFKNQLLVSGIVGSEQNRNFVRSKGEIIGEVIERFEYKIPVLAEKRIYQKRHKDKMLEFFGVRIPLSFVEFRTTSEYTYSKRQLEIFDKKLPILYYERITDTYVADGYFQSKETALGIAKNMLAYELKNKSVDFFNVFKSEIYEENGEYRIILTVKYDKNIIKEDFLQISDENQLKVCYNILN